MSIREIEKLEAAGRLLYASPLNPDALEWATMPDGRMLRAVKPAIPISWDFRLRRFAEHSDRPVVCAALLARMAVVRGLAHPVHHPELAIMERCHGWTYEEKERRPVGLPCVYATAAIHAAVRRKRDDIRAWVYDLGEPAAPFSRFPPQLHQYRAEVPIEFQDAFEITGGDWPEDVAVVAPYDTYASYEELRLAAETNTSIS